MRATNEISHFESPEAAEAAAMTESSSAGALLMCRGPSGRAPKRILAVGFIISLDEAPLAQMTQIYSTTFYFTLTQQMSCFISKKAAGGRKRAGFGSIFTCHPPTLSDPGSEHLAEHRMKTSRRPLEALLETSRCIALKPLQKKFRIIPQATLALVTEMEENFG